MFLRNSAQRHPIAIGAFAGASTCALLTGVAMAAGNDSFAKGIAAGGVVGIAAVSALRLLAKRRNAPAEARLVANAADERERALAVRAMAHAAIAMYVAAIVGAFVVVFDGSPALALFGVMAAGLVTAAASFIISVRRT